MRFKQRRSASPYAPIRFVKDFIFLTIQIITRADPEILIRGRESRRHRRENRGAKGVEGVGASRGGVPLFRKIFGFCISNGDFWCILMAIFYSLDARFTHKKQRFGLEIGGQIHKLGSTETANDTRNFLMENMLCLFSTIRRY